MNIGRFQISLNHEDPSVVLLGLSEFRLQVLTDHNSLETFGYYGRAAFSNIEDFLHPYSSVSINGVLQEYIQKSPQMEELFILWDLPGRDDDKPLVAAHTACIAAILHVSKSNAIFCNTIVSRILCDKLKSIHTQLCSGSIDIIHSTIGLLLSMMRTSKQNCKDVFQKLVLSGSTIDYVMSKGKVVIYSCMKNDKYETDSRLMMSIVVILIMEVVEEANVLELFAEQSLVRRLLHSIGKDSFEAIKIVLVGLLHVLHANVSVLSSHLHEILDNAGIRQLLSLYSHSESRVQDEAHNFILGLLEYMNGALTCSSKKAKQFSSAAATPFGFNTVNSSISANRCSSNIVQNLHAHVDSRQEVVLMELLFAHPNLLGKSISMLSSNLVAKGGESTAVAVAGGMMSFNREQLQTVKLLIRLLQAVPIDQKTKSQLRTICDMHVDDAITTSTAITTTDSNGPQQHQKLATVLSTMLAAWIPSSGLLLSKKDISKVLSSSSSASDIAVQRVALQYVLALVQRMQRSLSEAGIASSHHHRSTTSNSISNNSSNTGVEGTNSVVQLEHLVTTALQAHIPDFQVLIIARSRYVKLMMTKGDNQQSVMNNTTTAEIIPTCVEELEKEPVVDDFDFNIDKVAMDNCNPREDLPPKCFAVLTPHHQQQQSSSSSSVSVYDHLYELLLQVMESYMMLMPQCSGLVRFDMLRLLDEYIVWDVRQSKAQAMSTLKMRSNVVLLLAILRVLRLATASSFIECNWFGMDDSNSNNNSSSSCVKMLINLIVSDDWRAAMKRTALMKLMLLASLVTDDDDGVDGTLFANKEEQEEVSRKAKSLLKSILIQSGMFMGHSIMDVELTAEMNAWMNTITTQCSNSNNNYSERSYSSSDSTAEEYHVINSDHYSKSSSTDAILLFDALLQLSYHWNTALCIQASSSLQNKRNNNNNSVVAPYSPVLYCAMQLMATNFTIFASHLPKHIRCHIMKISASTVIGEVKNNSSVTSSAVSAYSLNAASDTSFFSKYNSRCLPLISALFSRVFCLTLHQTRDPVQYCRDIAGTLQLATTTVHQSAVGSELHSSGLVTSAAAVSSTVSNSLLGVGSLELQLLINSSVENHEMVTEERVETMNSALITSVIMDLISTVNNEKSKLNNSNKKKKSSNSNKQKDVLDYTNYDFSLLHNNLADFSTACKLISTHLLELMPLLLFSINKQQHMYEKVPVDIITLLCTAYPTTIAATSLCAFVERNWELIFYIWLSNAVKSWPTLQEEDSSSSKQTASDNTVLITAAAHYFRQHWFLTHSSSSMMMSVSTTEGAAGGGGGRGIHSKAITVMIGLKIIFHSFLSAKLLPNQLVVTALDSNGSSSSVTVTATSSSSDNKTATSCTLVEATLGSLIQAVLQTLLSLLRSSGFSSSSMIASVLLNCNPLLTNLLTSYGWQGQCCRLLLSTTAKAGAAVQAKRKQSNMLLPQLQTTSDDPIHMWWHSIATHLIVCKLTPPPSPPCYDAAVVVSQRDEMEASLQDIASSITNMFDVPPLRRILIDASLLSDSNNNITEGNRLPDSVLNIFSSTISSSTSAVFKNNSQFALTSLKPITVETIRSASLDRLANRYNDSNTVVAKTTAHKMESTAATTISSSSTSENRATSSISALQCVSFCYSECEGQINTMAPNNSTAFYFDPLSMFGISCCCSDVNHCNESSSPSILQFDSLTARLLFHVQQRKKSFAILNSQFTATQQQQQSIRYNYSSYHSSNTFHADAVLCLVDHLIFKLTPPIELFQACNNSNITLFSIDSVCEQLADQWDEEEEVNNLISNNALVTPSVIDDVISFVIQVDTAMDSKSVRTNGRGGEEAALQRSLGLLLLLTAEPRENRLLLHYLALLLQILVLNNCDEVFVCANGSIAPVTISNSPVVRNGFGKHLLVSVLPVITVYTLLNSEAFDKYDNELMELWAPALIMSITNSIDFCIENIASEFPTTVVLAAECDRRGKSYLYALLIVLQKLLLFTIPTASVSLQQQQEQLQQHINVISHQYLLAAVARASVSLRKKFNKLFKAALRFCLEDSSVLQWITEMVWNTYILCSNCNKDYLMLFAGVLQPVSVTDYYHPQALLQTILPGHSKFHSIMSSPYTTSAFSNNHHNISRDNSGVAGTAKSIMLTLLLRLTLIISDLKSHQQHSDNDKSDNNDAAEQSNYVSVISAVLTIYTGTMSEMDRLCLRILTVLADAGYCPPVCMLNPSSSDATDNANGENSRRLVALLLENTTTTTTMNTVNFSEEKLTDDDDAKEDSLAGSIKWILAGAGGGRSCTGISPPVTYSTLSRYPVWRTSPSQPFAWEKQLMNRYNRNSGIFKIVVQQCWGEGGDHRNIDEALLTGNIANDDYGNEEENDVGVIWKNDPLIHFSDKVLDPSYYMPAIFHVVRNREVSVRQLANCGALSLVIAALSSLCPVQRSISLACLYCIHNMLQQQTPDRDAAFRERAQLQLLLTYICDAFQSRDPTDENNNDESADNVITMSSSTVLDDGNCYPPRLPVTMAIFLGRCAMNLMQPSHELYGRVNKYLLCRPFCDIKDVPLFDLLLVNGDAQTDQTQRLSALRLFRDGLLTKQDHLNLCRKNAYNRLMLLFPLLAKDTKAGHAVLDVLDRGLSYKTSARYLLERCSIAAWIKLLAAPMSAMRLSAVITIEENIPKMAQHNSNSSNSIHYSKYLVRAVSILRRIVAATYLLAFEEFHSNNNNSNSSSGGDEDSSSNEFAKLLFIQLDELRRIVVSIALDACKAGQNEHGSSWLIPIEYYQQLILCMWDLSTCYQHSHSCPAWPVEVISGLLQAIETRFHAANVTAAAAAAGTSKADRKERNALKMSLLCLLVFRNLNDDDADVVNSSVMMVVLLSKLRMLSYEYLIFSNTGTQHGETASSSSSSSSYAIIHPTIVSNNNNNNGTQQSFVHLDGLTDLPYYANINNYLAAVLHSREESVPSEQLYEFVWLVMSNVDLLRNVTLPICNNRLSSISVEKDFVLSVTVQIFGTFKHQMTGNITAAAVSNNDEYYIDMLRWSLIVWNCYFRQLQRPHKQAVIHGRNSSATADINTNLYGCNLSSSLVLSGAVALSQFEVNKNILYNVTSQRFTNKQQFPIKSLVELATIAFASLQALATTASPSLQQKKLIMLSLCDNSKSDALSCSSTCSSDWFHNSFSSLQVALSLSSSLSSAQLEVHSTNILNIASALLSLLDHHHNNNSCFDHVKNQAVQSLRQLQEHWNQIINETDVLNHKSHKENKLSDGIINNNCSMSNIQNFLNKLQVDSKDHLRNFALQLDVSTSSVSNVGVAFLPSDNIAVLNQRRTLARQAKQQQSEESSNSLSHNQFTNLEENNMGKRKFSNLVINDTDSVIKKRRRLLLYHAVKSGLKRVRNNSNSSSSNSVDNVKVVSSSRLKPLVYKKRGLIRPKTIGIGSYKIAISY